MNNDRSSAAPGSGVDAMVGRAIEAYANIAERFGPLGGLERLFALYEQIQAELERVGFGEIDATAQDIKTAIEALLKMDYELRRLNNLKLAMGGGGPHER